MTTNGTYTVTHEQTAVDDEDRVIQTNEVRVHFVAYPYIPAQGPTYDSGGQPAEGGYSEFDGADVLGNQGGWIRLRGCDPLYIWAEANFDENACNDELERQVWDRAEYEYDRDRDDRLMGMGRFASVSGGDDW